MAHNFDSNVDFGDRRPLASPLSTLRHPIVTLSHVGFRGASIFFYVFANVLSSSFIVQFLIILSLLSADFWAVKNVTGRLMVGLRWWNFVDEEGRNHWKFESSKTPDNYDPMERRIFWGALTVAPVFWLFLAAIAFFTFQWQWMVVASLGLAMSLPNLYGYLRCKWNSTQEVTNYLTKWALFSMFKRTVQQQQGAGAGLPTFTPQMTATI